LGFDLLNPTPPAIPKPPQHKLKEFFCDLKEDPKLLVAELKMVCAERRCLFDHKLEKVTPIDLVAAVRDRIETLNTQEQLDRLSDAVKEKYKDVFSPIPHLDDCPRTFIAVFNSRMQLKHSPPALTVLCINTKKPGPR
jgi:hypothetical protein